jgi:hypothetical protein
MNKIGQEITQKRTSELNTKDREDFERFVQEEKKKRMKEQQEEKLTSKMPNKEGNASDADKARQKEELAKEKHAFDARHNIQIDDIERE